ncbi:MAG: HAD family hydrolase [Dysgonomonas sp.]
MINIDTIKGIIFDYGGTIDSNGKHWAEVLWESYQDNHVPISKDQFREAYVYAERHLATHAVITPEDDFANLLRIKVDIQIEYLYEKGYLIKDDKTQNYSIAVSSQCYIFAKNLIRKEKSILSQLHEKYPMVLVSNFYGNIHAVLKDFELLGLFDDIIESAVVGIRKPDPAIFTLGVKRLKLEPSEIVVIGDSYKKDIVPATINGCKTIWLKGLAWDKEDDDAAADIVISDFEELRSIFGLN